MQVGKKKLVLDHLIVQKMDDENQAGEDLQSILTYGAQALFEADQEAKDITCEFLLFPYLPSVHAFMNLCIRYGPRLREAHRKNRAGRRRTGADKRRAVILFCKDLGRR
jgi:hypothetical protein